MKNHQSLLISYHDESRFWTAILGTFKTYEDDDIIIKKLEEVRIAFELIVDAKHHWNNDPEVQSELLRFEQDRASVYDHSVALLTSQLKSIIPAKLLNPAQEYLVDLDKLKPEQAHQCQAIFQKIEQYKQDRFAEIYFEEQQLAKSVLFKVCQGVQNKLAIHIASNNFFALKCIPDKILDNIILQFNAKEMVYILRHQGGACLTLLKNKTTLSLHWQASMLL